MIRSTPPGALTLAGAASLAGAALSGEAAWLHMRWTAQAYGAICGQAGIVHCPACPAALALAAAGLAFLAAAARRRALAARSRAR